MTSQKPASGTGAFAAVARLFGGSFFLSLAVFTLTILILHKYDVVNYFREYTIIGASGPSSASVESSGRVFDPVEFNPGDRFHIHDNFKYGWIVTIAFIIIASLLLSTK